MDEVNDRLDIVFDFGAVLFRFEPLAVVASIWPEQARGEAETAALARRVFGAQWQEFDRGVVTRDELVPLLAAGTGLDEPRLARLIALVQRQLEPVPDSVALLPRLKARGHRLLYLSNMSREFADALDPERRVLPWFEDGLYSCDLRLVKPDAEIFHTAERRFGIAPARTVFIDDQPANVAAARECGWDAFQFVDAARCMADLQRRHLLPGVDARETLAPD